ncbi:MAG: DUF1653 domain-containing protein [Bdellovibrionales bacterium]|nr:DUF1653 domain-containing protein [Bdellovibrionales bacterium]
MQTSKIVAGGVYQHYKGPKYKVIDTVRHSESLEELVLYECLYENELGKLWVRPLKMFGETVEINGVTTPRFKLVEE